MKSQDRVERSIVTRELLNRAKGANGTTTLSLTSSTGAPRAPGSSMGATALGEHSAVWRRSVLDLQRTAGNRATAQLLSRRRTSPQTKTGSAENAARGRDPLNLAKPGKIAEARYGGSWGASEEIFRRKLGVTEFVNLRTLTSREQRAAILTADVVVFTGHHLVHVGGEAGQFHSRVDPFDPKSFRLRRVMGGEKAYTVQLAVIGGCYGLERGTLDLFRSIFPNAVVVGFLGSSPGRAETEKRWEFMSRFVTRIPAKLDRRDEVVGVWKEWIEEASTSRDPLTKLPTQRSPGFYIPENWESSGRGSQWGLKSRGQMYYWTGAEWKMRAVR